MNEVERIKNILETHGDKVIVNRNTIKGICDCRGKGCVGVMECFGEGVARKWIEQDPCGASIYESQPCPRMKPIPPEFKEEFLRILGYNRYMKDIIFQNEKILLRKVQNRDCYQLYTRKRDITGTLFWDFTDNTTEGASFVAIKALVDHINDVLDIPHQQKSQDKT